MVLTLFIIAGFGFVFVRNKDGMLDLIQLWNKRDTIVQKNHQILKENLFLLEEINKLKSAKYLEQKARTDLGLVRNNETVFILKRE